VLDKNRQFLALPHAVQELVSAEKTPTPVMLPAYEELLHLVKLMKPPLPNIAHGINAAIEKLSAYFAKTQKTRMYALALGSFIYLHCDRPFFLLSLQ
jgi:Rad3-related DNA helicase